MEIISNKKDAPSFVRYSRKHNFILLCGVFMLLFAPFVLFAVLDGEPSRIYGIIKDIFNSVVFFLIALTFVIFLWGVFKYISTSSLDGKAGAKETIIYGLIGLFVMLATWGLVGILLGTFGFSGTGPVTPTPPKAFRP